MKIETLLRAVRQDVRAALKEDCPKKDITTSACVPPSQTTVADVIAKQALTVSGVRLFKEALRQVDANLRAVAKVKDGEAVGKGTLLLTVRGKSASLLRAERVALNYFQRTCGIATLTARFVREVEGTKARILDTRKTTPNLRLLEKYAVACGGGANHRMSLSDQPLIKENHIRSAGGIASAVRRVKKGTRKPVILEVTDRREVCEGLDAGADILLLDNMTAAQVKEMVRLINGRALVEVSGGINLKNVRRYALAGADRISIGALTHSAPSVDISLLFR